MDPPKKRLTFLHRSTTLGGRSLQDEAGFSRTDSIPSSLTHFSRRGPDEDEKGRLGLTTLYHPVSPVNPVVDIVFIHGLGGGSRKTWSYSSDPDHFWPSWLVTDSEFVDVRLHTFGYNADWSERGQNVFDIHSFGQLLLSSLRNHPDIRRSATRIILVGHSMGGCVAKQAYLLARHDPSAKDIADRIHSFFFLATPHQGSDMATMLENMLSITIGKKPYVTDLAPNSVALKTINDEFRLVVGGLRLVSFYETRPMRVAGLNRFVVDTTSAQLGLPNEEIIPLNADHRHVCKFANREDPNFQLIRNSLITAVDSIKDAVPGTLNHYVDTRIFKQQSSGVSFSPKEQHLTPSEALILRSFLNVAGPIDSEFETLRLLRQPNSCEWFTYRNTFQSWISGRSTAGVLWLVGKPAAGKSIMSTHVIEYLQQSNLNCSFFFCKHSETGGSMLSSIFLSLAYQMALQDRLVRDSILQLAQSDLIWDKTEEMSVWKQLFVNCIFKLQSLDQHFWVIDAIDECPNFNVLFTKKLLATLPSSLRLFATSRKMDEIERGLQGSLGPSRVEIYELQDTDTWDDIRLFVNTRLTDLGLSENDEDRERMCEKILKKSFGSFLWARLVLEELETIWTEEDIDTVLDNIPGNLFEYYARMVRSIVEDKRKIGLASTILTWVVLARRPLTIEELTCAVKLDLGQTPLLARAKTALPSLCGQLVFVDKYNKVHLIHETVREFLTKHDMLAQELFMRQKNGHTRLGLLLIQYLSGPVLKLNPLSHLAPFKVQLHGSSTSGRALPKQQSSGVSADSALLDYASVFFSDHLLHAMSEDHELMQALFNFLQSSNVLSWIEHVAKLKDLKPLTQTAMNLRNYLTRRVKYVAPTDRAIQFADDWVTDLIRVPAKFCDQLLACPSAIQTLIPPLCPPHSAISRTFGSDARNLVVRGLRPGSWDDCLTYLDFVKGRPTSVSHGDHIFAVGLSTGEIWLYDYNTMQCLRTMKHPERVKILEFSTESTLLASAGPKQLSIWDPKSGALLQLFDFPPRCSPLAVVFLGTQEILAAFESKVLIKWDLETGDQDMYRWVSTDLDGSTIAIPQLPATKAAFLVLDEVVLLALGYRFHHVVILHALTAEPLGVCGANLSNNGIDCMAFNPNPEIPVLIVGYINGTLRIFDYGTMELQVERNDVYAQCLACSPDGRSVIVGTKEGVIEVFDLDCTPYRGGLTLTLIYRTSRMDKTIIGVAMSSDGHRFVDIRGQQARVWAPASLVRRNTSEVDSSAGGSEIDPAVSLPPRPPAFFSSNKESEITSLVATSDGQFIIAGKSNGDVVLFETSEAKQLGRLYHHDHRASVTRLVFAEPNNMVLSADHIGCIKVVVFQTPLSGIKTTSSTPPVHVILNRHIKSTVRCLLVNSAGDRVLVQGRETLELWEIPSGNIYAPHQDPESSECSPPQHLAGERPPGISGASLIEGDDQRSTMTRSIFQHPTESKWFVCVTGNVARIYAWANFAELTTAEGILLKRREDNATTEQRQWSEVSYHVSPTFVVEFSPRTRLSSPCITVWPAAQFTREATSAEPVLEPKLDAIAPVISSILRIINSSTILFVDSNLWICSAEVQSFSSTPGRSAVTRALGLGRPSQYTAVSKPTLASRTSSLPVRSQLPAASSNKDDGAQAQRHFFALSEWRTPGGDLLCAAVVPERGHGGLGGNSSRDMIAFAAGSRLVVIHGGLGFSERVSIAGNVNFPGPGASNTNIPSGFVAGGAVQTWNVISGSMHRRNSNW